MQRRELDLELEPERADEPVAVLAADRRPGDAQLLAVDATATRTRFVKSREARRRSSRDLDPALGRDRAAR